MVSLSLGIYVVIAVFIHGASGTHKGPDCPRHRGLPDGFSRTENRFRNRALYRLDLRHAINGFIPEKEYRFRVQTTARNMKFNDATVVIAAVDERCGTGSWVINTDALYSPKDCPSIVTTQQKNPMGRAYFIWIAPSCGCVHFRVRVHVNGTYYIDDEMERNGPLARTICPQPGSIKESSTEVPQTTTSTLPELLSRNDRLQLLCDVTEEHKAEDVMMNEEFKSKRTMSKLSSFEHERLNIAVERRHLEILNCCDLDSEIDKFECFGDIRRIRIDTFCGSGEPDIPLTKTRYDWIKQKQPQCCPLIGEARYRCFNHTLYEEDMMRDSHGHHTSIDMDDFDPVNYLEDYPKVEEIKTKFTEKRKKVTNTTDQPESLETNEVVQYKHDKVETKDTRKIVQNKHNAVKPIEKSVNTDSDADIDEDDEDDEEDENHEDDEDDADDEDDNEKEKKPLQGKNEKDNSMEDDIDHDSDDNDELSDDTREDDAKNRNMSIEECCMNGIDAGTRVVADGFEGCFKMADKLNAFFTKWSRKCDRHFVVCCMRVIDGLTSTKGPLM